MTSESEWTILKLINWTTDYFKSRHIDSPRVTAEVLLAHALNQRRIDLYIRYDQPVVKDELSHFKALINRRIDCEPVAYITGFREFWSMDFAVNRDVLIPRPETECLVEAALDRLPEHPSHDSDEAPMRVFEPGTGSGAVITALASERPGHVYFASDISVKAVETARSNAARHDCGHAVRFFLGDWLMPLRHNTQSMDLIVSNPPYVQTRDIRALQPEISGFEPVHALDGGEDGLDAIRCIILNAGACLKKGGHLLIETGHDQKDRVGDIAERCGDFTDIAYNKDYSGHFRVACMRRV